MLMKNIVVMIPFCRTPEECEKVINVMKKYGLERNVDGLKIFLMCEIPSNVIEEIMNFIEFSSKNNELLINEQKERLNFLE